jgi:hypothetical protein
MVIISSKFIKARATSVQDASSWMFSPVAALIGV